MRKFIQTHFFHPPTIFYPPTFSPLQPNGPLGLGEGDVNMWEEKRDFEEESVLGLGFEEVSVLGLGFEEVSVL